MEALLKKTERKLLQETAQRQVSLTLHGIFKTANGKMREMQSLFCNAKGLEAS